MKSIIFALVALVGSSALAETSSLLVNIQRCKDVSGNQTYCAFSVRGENSGNMLYTLPAGPAKGLLMNFRNADDLHRLEMNYRRTSAITMQARIVGEISANGVSVDSLGTMQAN